LTPNYFWLKSKGNTIFWAIIVCLLWSTAYAGIKIGLKYDTPFQFAGVRFIIPGFIIITGSLIMFYRSTKEISAIQENSILL
jgi:drug/metabolite transporter (DMT)-like permease